MKFLLLDQESKYDYFHEKRNSQKDIVPSVMLQENLQSQ